MNTKKNIKVLFIDDDANIRTVFKDAMGTAGFEIELAADGDEGLKRAFSSHPDVIVLDVMMPKMDGWQVLHMLRTDPWGKTVQVIMLTALGEMDNVAHAVDEKVFAYIVKSDLHIGKLAEVIEGAAKNKMM